MQPVASHRRGILEYIHLINTVRIWERRLEIEREKQQNAQNSSYSSSLAEPERLCKVRKPVFARFAQDANAW